MKSSLLSAALTFAVSLTAFAASANPLELAHFGEVRIPKNDRSLINRSANISIFDDSTAVVNFTRYTNSSADAKTTEATFDLSFATMETIRPFITQLSTADLDSTISPVVCMMLPPFPAGQELSVRRGYDATSGKFGGEVQSVLRRNGCWDGVRVNPTDSFAESAAFELRGMLKALVMELSTKN